jgi:hypothetical protein
MLCWTSINNILSNTTAVAGTDSDAARAILKIESRGIFLQLEVHRLVITELNGVLRDFTSEKHRFFDCYLIFLLKTPRVVGHVFAEDMHVQSLLNVYWH